MLAAVVVAAPPVGVAHDGLPAYFVESYLHGRVAVCRGDRDHGRHSLGMTEHPLHRLHPPHRPPSHGEQAFDTQVVHEEALRPHHVLDGDHREPETIGGAGGWIEASRTRAALTAADDVRADHEVL